MNKNILDSFLFQTKMVELEYTNIYEMKTFIMNKIYGSYYKLYCTIYEFLNNYCKENCLINWLIFHGCQGEINWKGKKKYIL